MNSPTGIKINFKLACPANVSVPATPVMLQPPLRPTVDSIQSLRTINEPHCCKRLLELLLSPFIWAGEMISRLFGGQAEIDPVLQAKWDQVVQKNYDLPGTSNPYYCSDVNACRRGKTIADDLVKAMARTTISPPFKQVLIYEIYNAGELFTSDGFYGHLVRQAREGKFNNPETLIIFAIKDRRVINDEQAYIQAKIVRSKNQGYPIDNAKCVVLTPSETEDIKDQRLPKKLLTLLQQP